jgi:MFS family permease
MLSPHLQLPHYFTKTVSKKIEELAASVGIGNLALAIITLFEPVFLYAVLGLSIPQVLLFFASVYAWYLVLIPFGAKIVSRYGYAHGVFLSIPFYVLYWAALFLSQHNFWLLYLAPLFFAIQKSLFWPAFHASVSRFSQEGQEAREFSLIYSLMHFAQIVGPFLGGWLSARYGFGAMFFVAAVIFFASSAPLFLSKEEFVVKVYQYRDTWVLFRTLRRQFWGYVGFGEELLLLTIWPIFLFLAVGDFGKLGGYISATTLVATLIVVYVGKFTDTHPKHQLLRRATVVYMLVWLSRLFVSATGGVLVVDAISRAMKNIVFIPTTAITYLKARQTHILPHAVFFEQSLSVGKLSAALIGAGVFTITGSFPALFILAALYTLFYLLV